MQPAEVGPIPLQVVVHVNAKSPALLYIPQIHEAVCISNPDGYVDFAPLRFKGRVLVVFC